MLSGSTDAHLLRACGDDPAFRATRSAYLLLDRELRVVAANPAYCEATLRSPSELDGRPVFEAFPADPATPWADGVANLGASLRRVLRLGRRDHMPVQRYDIPAPDGPGFVERTWLAVNSPVRETGGRVIGVLHHVEDVTGLLTDPGPGRRDEATARDPAAAALARSLDAENGRLRDRFSRHVAIEQAKGVLMARRGCSADEAFALLRGISHDTNTKLHRVAEALLEDTAGGADR